MPHVRNVVKVGMVRPTSLPERLREGGVWVDQLRERGVMAEVAGRLEIYRRGGFPAVCGMVYMFMFFSSGCTEGLRSFHRRWQGWWEGLAVLAGLRALPTSASLSRMLSMATFEQVRPFVSWLLTEAVVVADILAHPATWHRDAQGRPWNIFDYDPTNIVLRQRDLPEREDLPEAVRLGPRIGEPGHTGRKRGELVVSRSVVQHAGSGLVISVQVGSGKSEGRERFEGGLQQVVQLCQRREIPLERVLYRADGEFDGVPYLTAVREAGVGYLTRCSRYSLLDKPEILERLAEARWVAVPDSGCGPQREAADIGWVLFEAASETRRGDGLAYEPIRVRLVASRYRVSGTKKPFRGVVREGYCVELFCGTVEEDSWPAHEVVHLYCDRACLENRFAQWGSEIGVNRVFSYNLPGQELATAIGAFLWNLRTVTGFAANPPAEDQVPPQARLLPPEVPKNQNGLPPCEDRGSESGVACQEDAGVREPTRSEQESETLHEPIEAPAVSEDESSETSEPEEGDGKSEDKKQRRETARSVLRKWLPKVFENSSASDRGFTLDMSMLGIVCPAGRLFIYTSVAAGPNGNYSARFRSREKACPECSVPNQCGGHREQTGPGYMPSLRMPTVWAEEIRRFQEHRPKTPKEKPPLVLEPPPGNIPRFTPAFPCLVPSEARRAASRVASSVSIAVEYADMTEGHKEDLASHPMIVANPRRRSHCRLSREEILARYRLPERATVTVTLRVREAEHATLTCAFQAIQVFGAAEA